MTVICVIAAIVIFLAGWLKFTTDFEEPVMAFILSAIITIVIWVTFLNDPVSAIEKLSSQQSQTCCCEQCLNK